MYIPNGLCLFQTVGTLFGISSAIVALRSYREAQDWNKCAQTLSVNQCPFQEPAEVYKCRSARAQMDSFEKREIQAVRRSDPPKNGKSELEADTEEGIDRQTSTLYIFASTLGASLFVYLVYFFISLNGQLCVGKLYNLFAASAYTLCSYWTTELIILFNGFYKGPYGGGHLCSLTSTLPVYDFGHSPVLAKCFQDYYLCQNAILAMVGVGLSVLAAIFHLIAFVSSCWDCHTQIDTNDWGVPQDLGEIAEPWETEVIKYPFEDDYYIITDDPKKKKKKKKKPEKQEEGGKKMTHVRMKNVVKPLGIE